MVTCADCIPNNVERGVLLCPKHRATDQLLTAAEQVCAEEAHEFNWTYVSASALTALRVVLAKFREEAYT